MNPIKTIVLLIPLLLCQSCALWPWKESAALPKERALPDQWSQPVQSAPLRNGALQQAQTAPPSAISAGESGRLAYRSADLTLEIQADPQLNRFQNNAHTLVLCIYQLKDPNLFLQLAEEKDGIPRLLECGRFDASVANAKRMVIQPGQRLRESRDRAEGSRYVGIVAGYYGSGRQRLSDLRSLSLNYGDVAGSIAIELGAYEIEKVTVK